MKAIVILVFSACIHGFVVPTKHFVSKEFIDVSLSRVSHVSHRPSTLYEKYLVSIYQRTKSIERVVASGDDFHRDALLFALLDTEIYAEKIEQLSFNATESVVPDVITFREYELLLNTFVDPRVPRVHARFANSSLLTQLSQSYVENFEIIYIPEVFDSSTFDRIQKETARLWTSVDVEANCNLDGRDRMGGYVHFSSSTTASSQRDSLYSLLFGNEPLRLLVSSVVGTPVHPSDFPIELREYGPYSRGMGCHADIQMYKELKSNFELVVTVSNKGECEVYWFDRNNVKHSVWPEPNSLTIVHPNAAVHCVSPTKGGPREMIKFIMVGSYEKSNSFYNYVDNRCGSNNPNVQAIEKRRASRTSKGTDGEL